MLVLHDLKPPSHPFTLEGRELSLVQIYFLPSLLARNSQIECGSKVLKQSHSLGRHTAGRSTQTVVISAELHILPGVVTQLHW